MNDLERINLILAELERNAVLKADKSKMLMLAVNKLTAARGQEALGVVTQKLAEDEILALQNELSALDKENERNINALRSLQQVITVADELTSVSESTPDPIE